MQFRKTLLLLLAAASLDSSLSALTAEGRVAAWINVQDYSQAVIEAEQLVLNPPQSKHAWTIYLKALGKVGDEKKLIAAWKNYLVLFPEENKNRELLETLAWSIIEKGCQSSTQIVRLYSCLGAYFGQDAKSISILRNMLHDTSAQIRAIAAKLTSDFRDSPLQDEILKRLELEKHPLVREEVIRAVGKMKIFSAENKLVAILTENTFTADEKSAAIESLVNLKETISHSDLQQLISSNRAGLRELACKVISHTFDKSQAKVLIPLLGDSCSDVRNSAVQALGLLRIEDPHIIEKLHFLLKDPDPYVAISSAWALTLYHSQSGLDALQKWLKHSNKDTRRFASGALAATGAYGISLMRSTLNDDSDTFVRVNIALGLLSQRKNVAEASKVLSQFLKDVNDRIMWSNQGEIRYLTESDIKFHPIIPNLPESKNLHTRLELLNLLAIMEDPEAPYVVREFLINRSWGVTVLAATLLLCEADESFIKVVEGLLTDPERNVRIQAALILAVWGGDENSISLLQEVYQTSDREMKERILEGIGQIGSESSISFLVEAMTEPSQTLRIIAAASLLKCLYH